LSPVRNAIPSVEGRTPSASSSWTVSITRFSVGLPVAMSTMLTVSETWFETQSSLAPGRTARAEGSCPTSMVASSALFAVLTTLTLLLVVFAT
jgi:hypothetical protein